jgi:hypothetical protein
VFPNFGSIRDSITRSRNVYNINEGSDYSELPLNLRHTIQGDEFFSYDSGFGLNNRFVVFYSDFSVDVLRKANCWVVDGTFRMCPDNFYQLFTIHAYVGEKTVPSIYFLLDSKSEDIYSKIFSYLFQLGLNPEFIVSDFEIAVINAAKSVFLSVNCSGCVFHYGQCLFRRIQHHGMVTEYKKIKSL